jgi:imidazolonepropionase
MNEISVVNEGALLIHNGVIQEAGPSRRIENLRQARGAREIDAAGKVLMPAFVDADAALVAPLAAEMALRVVSRRRLEVQAASEAVAYARLGVLSLGAHTGYAADLRETTKTLLIHRALQNKPLRIRSILSPRATLNASEVIGKWLPAGRRKKLAGILEVTAPVSPEVREVATAGAGAGYSLRIRSGAALDEDSHQFALAGGAIAIVAPVPENVDYARRLSALSCVHVLTAAEALNRGPDIASGVRAHLEEGTAFALGSAFGTRGSATFNPQFLLHLAVARMGLTPEAAICAATWNAACALRMSHVTGSLEPGKTADALLMDVPDYRELPRRAGHSDVLLAMRAGQPVYRRPSLNGID